MSIQLIPPTPPLNQFIICFWQVDLQVPYQAEKILPTGTLELMFNFGDPFQTTSASGGTTRLHRSWLAGFQTEYIENVPQGRTHMLGVRFRPGGAHPFFTEPLRLFHNRVEPLAEMWGGLAEELRERLAAVDSAATRVQLLEGVLLDQLRRAPAGEAFVGYALRQLTRSGGQVGLDQLSEAIGVSQKHLIARFKQEVGVTPKQFGRVLRLQQVLRAVDPQRPLAWGEIASRAGYYDQSHFNREFRRFTGLTPADYVAYRQQFFGADLEAGDSVHFVPIR